MKPKSKKKKRMGRPPKGADARDMRVVIKATRNEVKQWKAAAMAEGMALGPWLVKAKRDDLNRK